MLTVPTHLPLDAELPGQEGDAQGKVELRRSLVNTDKHEYFSDLGKPNESPAR